MPEDKKKSWFRRHWIITTILVILLLLIIIGAFSSNPEMDNTNNANGNTIKEEEIKEPASPTTYEEAKQEAVNVSYEDLMRYSESYTGKWVCFKGGIIQVVSDIPKLELIVATKNDPYIGYLDDTIYLYSNDYSGERLLENDLIEFCGMSRGMITYTAVLGNKISIPRIETDELYVKRKN
jgi:hypothetical protein